MALLLGCGGTVVGADAEVGIDASNDASQELPVTPDVTALDVTVRDVAAPDVTVRDVAAPDVTVRDVATTDVTAPDVAAPDVAAPDVTAPDVTAPDVTAPDVTFSVSSSSCAVQTYSVPTTATYRIVALGGGVSGAGMGAQMQGDFSLAAGTELRIVVGAAGFAGYRCCSGPCGLYAGFGGTGAGGTFVMRGTTPLLVAGGGSESDAVVDSPVGAELNPFVMGGECTSAGSGGACSCGPGNPMGCSSPPPSGGGTGYTNGGYNQGGSSFNAGANAVNTAHVGTGNGSVSILFIERF